jgi:IclR family acetate operon transcriptional repressor
MTTATSRSKTEGLELELQVPNLQRGLAILEFIARQAQPVTLSELARTLDISLTSVFRITSALVELGYLTRDEKTKAFSLTRKFMMIGQPQGVDRSLIESSLEPMRDLRRATGETVQVGCLVEGQFVILDQLVATYPFKYVVDLGARVPVHTCAPGKAILAFMAEPERDDVIASIQFRRFTPTTIMSRKQLLTELATIRQSGYAVDRAEGLEGIHCIAAPLLSRHGEPIAAITIAGPAHRLPAAQFDSLGKLVIAAAQKASARFGH